MQQTDTVVATALRSLVMSGALIILAAATGGLSDLFAGRAEIDARAWLCLVAAGICGAGSWLAYFAALRVADVASVAALDRLSLPLVFVLGVAVLGEQVGWRGWMGLVLAVSGTYLIVWDRLSRVAA